MCIRDSTLTVITICFVLDIIHGLVEQRKPIYTETPLFIVIAFLILALIYYEKNKEQLGRKYYQSSAICMVLISISAITYEALCLNYKDHFMLTCLLFIIFTQLVGLRLLFICILSGACFIMGIVGVSIRNSSDHR